MAFPVRFECEAQTNAALHHPKIVEVFDFSIAGGMVKMLMEFNARTQAHWITSRPTRSAARNRSMREWMSTPLAYDILHAEQAAAVQ
jgi:hypothetical protein